MISDAVAGYAGLDVTAFARHEIAIRGRKEPLTIRVIDDARALPETLARPRARGQSVAPGVENAPAA